MADDEAVHLNPDSLDKYFRLDAVSIFQLSEKADALLEIDPTSEQLRLFVPAVGGMPEVDGLERVKVDRIARPGGGSRYRIVLDVAGMHYAGYQLIESIVAYLREGSTFTRAVAESIAVMRDLLANRGRLTDDEETGLWGELTLLEDLVSGIGEHSAVASWLGPVASEHDFSLERFEVEVKTTRGEGRRHLIASDTQLQPSPGRPLYLLSLQITLAGASQEGRTLPQVVADLRAILDDTSSQFEAALYAVGYRDGDADLYRTRFQFRSKPRAYLIDDNFPSITRPRLEMTVPNLQLVSEVRYRVDVGGLSPAHMPAPLDNFCEV